MSGRLGRLVRQVLSFLLGSGLGLAVDLSVFALGVRLGAAPWLANVVSAGCATVVVYLFVTKYAFAAERTRTGFLLFVGWYVVSIVLFSAFIEVLHVQTGWAPFVCKLVSLPPSFAANFVVSRLLLHRRAASGPAPGRGPAPARDTAGA
ncbi:GtrA family protein [Geodermatophilus sp. DSM 45219]|uniref:GtrA family protein n=1 Tax=Geodermatophilus sp. DSM 45219 TaxID=1881103 RepID=UPI00088E7B9E|nr:GtrA family protein [Geodermatophilus sp. DSM 45219]SDO32940.1 GtrA-like protein [Geodermatophilus sp. DSM 45219]